MSRRHGSHSTAYNLGYSRQIAPDRLHVAAFDSMGLVLKPKAPSRTASSRLAGISAPVGQA